MKKLLQQIKSGDTKALARSISLIENEAESYEELLQLLSPDNSTKIIGITGPPGAGKSTLADALIGELVKEGNLPAGQSGKVGVLCVDPSSPFNFGSLLGDRIRMSEWYNNPNVFIRSLATRGSLGGLHPKIIEITDVMKAAGFNHIIIETVGVGQSEVEIAGLADVTVVVLVPEGGDVIQTMKAGLMEIADIFVVNKSDRPGADELVKNLRLLTKNSADKLGIPVIKTIASTKEGIEELRKIIDSHQINNQDKKNVLMVEKAFSLIQHKKMKNISKEELYREIKNNPTTNLYKLIEKY